MILGKYYKWVKMAEITNHLEEVISSIPILSFYFLRAKGRV